MSQKFTEPGACIPIDMETTTELVRQLSKARKVLEFYADCYPQSGIKTKDDIFDDKGQRAREFLEGKT